MMVYILKSQIIWGVLILFYALFLKNNSQFRVNRVYLLFSLLAGLIFPLIQVHIPGSTNFISTPIYLLDTITINPMDNKNINQVLTSSNFLVIFKLLYFLGALFYFIRLVLGYLKIYKINIKGHLDPTNDSVIITQSPHSPFSYFGQIYISNKAFYTKQEWVALLNHENVHIKEGHTYDNVFLAVIKVIFWWSPLIRIYERAIKIQHEYIADFNALNKSPKGAYIKLLSKTFSQNNHLLLVNYFHNHTKKRLIMLLQNNNNTRQKFIYLAALPLLLILFLGVSCTKDAETEDNVKTTQTADETNTDNTDSVYKVVDNMPKFPGCEAEGNSKACADKKMLEYIYKNITYPSEAKNKGVEGTVVINFIVNKQGHIENANILRNPGSGTGEEALRVVKSMPHWIPGSQNGKVVSVEYNLPVKFKLQ